MVAHFADLWVSATIAGLYGAAFILTFFLRGATLWRSGNNGFGERLTLKFLKLASVYFATLVLYVAYALDKPFGHRLIGGHQIDRARYVLWTIINPLFIGVVGLSYSASEHYAIVGSVVQLVASLMSLVGAWNADSADAAVWFAVLGMVFQALSGAYLLVMCVPPPEYQAKHGGTGHFIVRAIIAILMFYFPIAFLIDNTYLNTIADDARRLSYATFVFGIVIHCVAGLYLLIMVDAAEAEATPLGWGSIGGPSVGSGMFTGRPMYQRQDLQSQGEVPVEQTARSDIRRALTFGNA